MSATKQAAQIARLEERQKNMDEKIDDLKDVVLNGFIEIKNELSEFKGQADNKYASKLTEKIVYGLVALILIAVFSALIAIVII